MNKSLVYFGVSLGMVFGAYFYIAGQIDAFSNEIDVVASRQKYYNPRTFKDKVRVVAPKPQVVITNPVTITGSVSGTWFFEGQIISRVVDAQGNVLGQGPLVAMGDWMTIESVGFSGVIPFSLSKTKDGFVIIEADNPSGDENPPSFKIPVKFLSDEDPVSCTGDSCGECTIDSLGSNGVCVHSSGTKNL